MRNARFPVRAPFVRGAIVLFPLYVLIFFVSWVIGAALRATYPVAAMIEEVTGWTTGVAEICAVVVAAAVCYFVGLLTTTRYGRWLGEFVSRVFFEKIPGYEFLRVIASRAFSGPDAVSSAPRGRKYVLFRPYDASVWCLGYIAHEHGGLCFVVQQSSPTLTGHVFIVEKRYVVPTDITIMEGIQVIASFGSGASDEMCRKVEAALAPHRRT